jgi:hypothetical protein
MFLKPNQPSQIINFKENTITLTTLASGYLSLCPTQYIEEGFQISINGKFLAPVGCPEIFPTQISELDFVKVNAGHRTHKIVIHCFNYSKKNTIPVLVSFSQGLRHQTKPNFSIQFKKPVRSLSQYFVRQKNSHRICSPTSIAMFLDAPLQSPLQKKCYHKLSNAYGVWSQNIWASQSFGIKAQFQFISKIEDLTPFKNKGIIASISYKTGALKNSPISKTRGHLVVITEIRGHIVICFDPAVSSPNPKPIHYSLDEFLDSWGKGLIYLLF